MLDTTHAFETPEGIELQLHVAGPVYRAGAWLVDVAIRAAIYLVLAFPLSFFGNFGTGFILIILFVVSWFYSVLFEVLQGATPGKKMFGLMVCHDDGTPIGWSASIIRNLLRVADFLPLFYTFGLVAMLSNQRFKRLGDMAAGSIVVYRDVEQKDYDIPEFDPNPVPLPLDLVEQRAIMDFAERSQRLSQERSVELADLLSPLTTTKGKSGRDAIFRFANWLRRGKD